jgi:GNAT superfamily N-acetyltransferase
MNISFADEQDYEWIKEHDHHLAKKLIMPKIKGKEIYLLRDKDETIFGWLRYGFFWDNTPFMNMLWIDEPYRSKGLGKVAVEHWEKEMKEQGYDLLMTSTQADEGSQHFYRKLGYQDAGGLLLDSQPLEIFFTKKLN